ncbi:MAG: hypothetical protein K9G62_01050 [Alphaproteobacteria bacterium]|nr:hypothetical protein [Alphaproteobacteria bacterium]
MFMPTTFMLTIGMLPTLMVLYVDRTRGKAQAITVGAMNLAGCSPFLFHLWGQGGGFDRAITLISSPKVIVAIYMAAAIGYLLDWAMSGIISSLLHQKGIMRMTAIQKRKEELLERWGPEITGNIKLDRDGFASVQETGRDEISPE